VGGCLGGGGGLGLRRFVNLIYGFKYGLGLMGFVGDEYLVSIESMMGVIKRWYRASPILALSGLALSFVALLPMWGIIVSIVIMIPTIVVLLASLLLWLLINLGIIRINYRITEINAGMVLGMIKDKDLDPNHLTRLVNEFSNFTTRFQVFSFVTHLVVFWGFFNLVFYATASLYGSTSLRPFATALAFVVLVSVSIIIALGSHYSELICEVYVHPELPHHLFSLIRSEEFTDGSLLIIFVIPMVLMLLLLPLILSITITRGMLILIIGASFFFALALSELVTALQWLMLVLVGRGTTQLFDKAIQLRARGVGSRQ
jgi:hypothetical protein